MDKTKGLVDKKTEQYKCVRDISNFETLENLPLWQQPIKGQGLPINCCPCVTYLQTVINDHSVSLVMTCSQHIMSPRIFNLRSH